MYTEFDFPTAHHLFFVHDKAAALPANPAGLWDDAPSGSYLSEISGTVAVRTASYGQAWGEIETLRAERPIQPNEWEEWDYMEEVSLEIRSGGIQISAATGHAVAHASLPSGSYRVRVYSLGRDTTWGEGEDEEGEDFYRVEVWSAPAAAPVVLKPYQPQP